MKPLPATLPRWLRIILLASAVCIAIGAAIGTYHYYTKPATLTVAVGSLDGEAGRVASLIASHFAATGAPVRLKIVNSGNVLGAAKAFAEGKVDLAVVREDVGDLSNAKSVVRVGHAVVMIVAPPDSSFASVKDLKGQTIGVVGGDINSKVVAALTREYDLSKLNITFKNISISDVRQAVQSNEVNALLMVVPLTRRYLSFVNGLFRERSNVPPSLIAIGSAGAIADDDGEYEVSDIPQGALQGAPPAPGSDVMTLRTELYLVASGRLDTDVVADLTQAIMKAKQDLMAEQPALSGIAAPSLDSDAYIPLHPGAAEFYSGTHKSFLDKYANTIFLVPIVFGVLASIFAAGWKFLEMGEVEAREAMLSTIYHLPRRIRGARSETDLDEIEEEIDLLLKAQLARSRRGQEAAMDVLVLHSAAHRLDNLVHHRRAMLTRAGSVES